MVHTCCSSKCLLFIASSISFALATTFDTTTTDFDFDYTSQSQPLPQIEAVLVDDLISFVERSSWARDHQSLFLPALSINDKLTVRTSKRMGHGVWTRHRIQPGEALVSIPWYSVVTMEEGVARHPRLNTIFYSISRTFRHLGDLAPFTLVLLLESRGCGSNKPRWLPYLNVMNPTPNHPLLWNHKQLSASSPVLKEKIIRLQEEIMLFYQTLLTNDLDYTFLREHYCPAMFVDVDQTMQRVTFGEMKWVVAHLLSNLFGVERNASVGSSMFHSSNVRVSQSSTSKLQLALIPFVHFFNHKSTALAHYKYDATRNVIDFWSAQEYEAGSQIYLQYGNLTDHLSMLNYGFVEFQGNGEDDEDDEGGEGDEDGAGEL